TLLIKLYGTYGIVLEISDIECGRMAYAKESGFHFREIKGNLFSCEKDTSLAHCISADVHMGKGIAATFKKMFGGVDELRRQGGKPGDVSMLQRDERFIYYL
ncbi:Hypothetical predicted protein, partial [Paramuricea clavata]